MDTPTRASSTGHTTLTTSLKPRPSRVPSATTAAGGGGNYRNNKPTFSYASRSARRVLGEQNVGVGLDDEALEREMERLEIGTDGTERERRTLEEEIRRGMGELERSDGESIGLGSGSEVEERGVRLEDESESSEGLESLEEEGMVGKGMMGSRGYRAGEGEGSPEGQGEGGEGDVSYITLSRSVSPASPRRFAPTLPTTLPQTQQLPTRLPPTSVPVPVAQQPVLRPRFATQDRIIPPSTARSQRTRLPDITGLTEGLASPVRGKGHYKLANGVVRDTQDAQLGQAIDQFKRRLAVLERDNELSGERVRDLEGRLYADQVESESSIASEQEEIPQRQAEQDGRSSAQVESLLARLSTLLNQAQPRNTLLEFQAGLSNLHEEVNVLSTTDAALVEEVQSLRHVLEGLGIEVGSVRKVVEGLVREEEGREAWEREERARGDGMGGRREEREDIDRTPRATRWKAPATPKNGRSYLGAEEIQRLREELNREEARKSPTPRTNRVKISTQPTNLSSNITCTRPHVDSPLRPTARPKPAAPTTESDEVDFARAEEIFRNVPQARTAAPVIVPGVCGTCRGSGEVIGRPSSAAGRESSSRTREKEAREAREAREAKEREQEEREQHYRYLEEEFTAHKAIYVELSEQYRAMDARVGGGKRRALARHLKESIDELEGKADMVRQVWATLQSADKAYVGGRMREGIV